MGIVHYLNVKNGDCSIIHHPSKRVTVIDVCNARKHEDINTSFAELLKKIDQGTKYSQKSNPTNPITYMYQHDITKVFRFILTHPDMDHMDGIKDFFQEFHPANFWDIKNKCIKSTWDQGPYRKEDWRFYCSLRDSTTNTLTKRLNLYAGEQGQFFNQDQNEKSGGDGLYVLAPTQELVNHANISDEYNDASYVILYRSNAGRILFAGDSHDKTWEHLLANHYSDIKDVEILIAPHHGRDSGRSYDFLDVVKPKLTLFGNAPSEHLAYGAWNRRDLHYITNNQAGDVIIDTNGTEMQVYVTSENYAQRQNHCTFYSSELKAYYLRQVGINSYA
jgi:beta-lactamase superfamily II metal-dependent hydrolase